MFKGQRRDVEPHLMEKGDYGKWRDQWWCRTPSDEWAVGNLSQHEVVEHEDRTITVSPSILVTMPQDGKDIELYHGYLVKGEWNP